MLTLYAAKNTVALAAHIALEESGLPYQIQWISFQDSDQTKPDFLRLNPKGRVPVLIDGDICLSETPAILDYIAERAPQLTGNTPFARAKIREMMAYCASTFHVNHAHKLRGARWSDDAAAHASMQAKVPETMAQSCAFVESELKGGWVAEAYSIADMHLYAVCRWLKGDGVDIADYPNLAQHHAAMAARTAVATVEAAHG